ncbi:MAG: hypothetical protein ACLRSW_06060 [Christensenellaceae bacterium]
MQSTKQHGLRTQARTIEQQLAELNGACCRSWRNRTPSSASPILFHDERNRAEGMNRRRE